MMYKAKVAVCSDISTKLSTQSECYSEFLNFKPVDTERNRQGLKGLRTVYQRSCTVHEFYGQFIKLTGQYTKVKGLYIKVPRLYMKDNVQYIKVNGEYTKCKEQYIKLTGEFTKFKGLYINVTVSYTKINGQYSQLLGCIRIYFRYFFLPVTQLL